MNRPASSARTFFEDPLPTGEEIPLDDVRLLAPVLPSKLVCVGKNYAAHAAEFGLEVPDEPLLFLKPSTSVIGPHDPIQLLPVSHRVDNVVTIEKDNLLAAGVAWPESLDRLKGSAYMIAERYGRGYVVTFADEPHFRLFWRGTLPLFLNTVLYAPSFPHD